MNTDEQSFCRCAMGSNERLGLDIIDVDRKPCGPVLHVGNIKDIQDILFVQRGLCHYWVPTKKLLNKLYYFMIFNCLTQYLIKVFMI